MKVDIDNDGKGNENSFTATLEIRNSICDLNIFCKSHDEQSAKDGLYSRVERMVEELEYYLSGKYELNRVKNNIIYDLLIKNGRDAMLMKNGAYIVKYESVGFLEYIHGFHKFMVVYSMDDKYVFITEHRKNGKFSKESYNSEVDGLDKLEEILIKYS